jgi:Methyltransferase domain
LGYFAWNPGSRRGRPSATLSCPHARQFYDHIYIRRALARVLEAEVAAAVTSAIKDDAAHWSLARPPGSVVSVMNVVDYLSDPPKLHSWDGGHSWNTGGFEASDLAALFAFCARHLPPAPAIVETGAGNTTICFLHLRPRRLVSIARDEERLFERIRGYCVEKGVPIGALEPSTEASEWALPKLASPGNAPEFDCALIDGNHNWPSVFVDFFYLNYMVKKGGFIMLDDIQIYSVSELARLLACEERAFRLRHTIRAKAMIFEKITDERELGGFTDQPYILARSLRRGSRFPLARLASHFTRWFR